MRRRLALLALLILGIIGFVLVITADESAVLEATKTAEGVWVEVPIDWQAEPDRPFEYRPPVSAGRLTDRWIVAWTCGGDGCEPRSLQQWRAMATDLPTFVGIRDAEGSLLFDVTESGDESSYVLASLTQAGETQVAVAVFFDGSDHYLECGVSVFDDVDDLATKIVEACRAAVPPRS